MKIEDFFPKIKKNISLAQYTTFKIGGKAQYFLEVNDEAELKETIFKVSKLKIPFFILGGGSNLLISNNGYDGLVIKINYQEIEINNNLITVSAGVFLSKLLQFSISESLSGLEWAIGVPGTIGGAIRGNAGAFDLSIGDSIKNVFVINTNNQKVEKISHRDCKFDYRTSIFKKKNNLIILKAEIFLHKKDKNLIENQTREYLIYRKEKQPSGFSAGSVFKNYKIKNIIEKKRLIEEHPELEKVIKNNIIPSAFLIDKCNLKGKKIGRVMLSLVHANFIINLGRGKSEDVLKLIYIIKKEVNKKYGIILEEEIQYIK